MRITLICSECDKSLMEIENPKTLHPTRFLCVECFEGLGKKPTIEFRRKNESDELEI